MTGIIKFYLFAFIVCFAFSASGQSYAKYTTKAKDTVIAKRDKPSKKDIADFDALMKKAFNEYRVKKFDDATQTYTEAFAVSPDSMKFRVLHLRAYCYFTNGNFNKAIDDCTSAIEKAKIPNERALNELYALRSDAYNSRKEPGDTQRACDDYKKAMRTAYMRANKPLNCTEG